MVIYMHAFAIGMQNQTQDIVYTITRNKTLSGGLAVDIFFLISGFLIYRSYAQNSNIKRYAMARFLRIYPLYFIVIVLSYFGIGYFYSSLSFGEFLTSGSAQYLKNLVFLNADDLLPGVFSTHLVLAINGSIWTLRYEVLFYILVPFIAMAYKKDRRLSLVGAVAVAVLYFVSFKMTAPVGAQNLFRLAMFFMVGICYYLYEDKIVISLPIVVASIIGLAIGIYFFNFEITFAIFGAYLIMIWGFADSKLSRVYSKIGDLSYSTYLISFPIQQIVVETMGTNPFYNPRQLYMNPYLNMGVTLLIVLPLAFVSWRLIEKPFMNLKKIFFTN
jgi:peptidoglycan/LPS O-acetylase OafA/YrhL